MDFRITGFLDYWISGSRRRREIRQPPATPYPLRTLSDSAPTVLRLFYGFCRRGVGGESERGRSGYGGSTDYGCF